MNKFNLPLFALKNLFFESCPFLLFILPKSPFDIWIASFALRYRVNLSRDKTGIMQASWNAPPFAAMGIVSL